VTAYKGRRGIYNGSDRRNLGGGGNCPGCACVEKARPSFEMGCRVGGAVSETPGSSSLPWGGARRAAAGAPRPNRDGRGGPGKRGILFNRRAFFVYWRPCGSMEEHLTTDQRVAGSNPVTDGFSAGRLWGRRIPGQPRPFPARIDGLSPAFPHPTKRPPIQVPRSAGPRRNGIAAPFGKGYPRPRPPAAARLWGNAVVPPRPPPSSTQRRSAACKSKDTPPGRPRAAQEDAVCT
jgi:hypothetical protein